jgi:hypothetical protein
MQRAIQDGRTTCKAVVQAYITRARAYNGVCTRLVTRDGADIPQASGTARAGAPIIFPKTTVAVSSLLPDFEKYTGLPIEYGRMEATASDPSVPQQYGMVVGIPNAPFPHATPASRSPACVSASCANTWSSTAPTMRR